MAIFNSLGEFALMVRSAPFDKGSQRSVSSYAGVNIASDGGYSVPQELVNQIFMRGENSLLPFCQIIPSASGVIEVPTDETTPWGSIGVIASWDDEADVAIERKPELSMANHKLKKLRVLVPASAELVEDAPAFNAWLPNALSRAVTWQINNEIVNGLGVARPLGIMKSAALIEVAKESAQVAGTIVAANITAMLDRCLDPMSAVWVMNPSCYSQVTALLAFDSGTRRLAGLPIVLTDACAARGSLGDIILANMGGYRVVSKGPAFSQSSHLFFDQGLVAFRLTVRLDGQPILRAPTTPPNSGATRSNFVGLAVRA